MEDHVTVSSSIEPVPVSPAVAASIPSAWRRTMQMDWSTDSGPVTLIYPGDLKHQDIDDLEQLIALAIKGMRRRAITIEAGTAGPAGLGAKHESVGPQGIAKTTGDA